MATITMTETTTNTQQQNGVSPVSSPYQTGSEQPNIGRGGQRHGGGRPREQMRSPPPMPPGVSNGRGGCNWTGQGMPPPPRPEPTAESIELMTRASFEYRTRDSNPWLGYGTRGVTILLPEHVRLPMEVYIYIYIRRSPS